MGFCFSFSFCTFRIAYKGISPSSLLSLLPYSYDLALLFFFVFYFTKNHNEVLTFPYSPYHPPRTNIYLGCDYTVEVRLRLEIPRVM